MRKRRIKMIGNSWYVKLEPADVRDWDKKEGDLVGVKPLEEGKE